MSRPTFASISNLLAVRAVWNNGHSIREIADVAKVSRRRVRAWLETTGVRTFQMKVRWCNVCETFREGTTRGRCRKCGCPLV